MPFSLLFQYGALLAAVVTAFAISTAVGMLVASLWAEPDPPGRQNPRPSRSDRVT